MIERRRLDVLTLSTLLFDLSVSRNLSANRNYHFCHLCFIKLNQISEGADMLYKEYKVAVNLRNVAGVTADDAGRGRLFCTMLYFLNPGASGCYNFVTKPLQLIFSPTS